MKVYVAMVTGKSTEVFSTPEKAKEYLAVAPPAELKVYEFEVDKPGPENGKLVHHMFID
jgi:hypothetical protein